MYSLLCTVHKASVQQLAQVGPNGAHHGGLRTEDARERRGAGQFVDTVHRYTVLSVYSSQCIQYTGIQCKVYTVYSVYIIHSVHCTMYTPCTVYCL